MEIRRLLKMVLFSPRRWKQQLLHGSHIDFTTEMRSGCVMYDCRIGKYCHIGRFCSFDYADIGNYCSIAPNVHIGGMEHNTSAISTCTWLSDEWSHGKRTKIGNDVWIATNSIIRQGITIGDGAVVGANSFVNKDVPPYAVVVGAPARIVRIRFPEEVVDTLLSSGYSSYAPKKAKGILSTIRKKFNL